MMLFCDFYRVAIPFYQGLHSDSNLVSTLAGWRGWVVAIPFYQGLHSDDGMRLVLKPFLVKKSRNPFLSGASF